MSAPFPADADWIREHGRFMRGLATALLADGGRADDAVQDAWVAALEAGAPSRPAAWLARVTRRRAHRQRRESRRRQRREHAAARPEAQPSAASSVERAEVVRLVSEVVGGMREPYREALLLRFYEDLPPRAIAARLGVPVATVSSRIQRGLALARAELVRRDGGSWRASLGLACGFAQPSRPTPWASGLWIGTMTMTAKTWVLCGAAVVLVGLGTWLGVHAATRDDAAAYARPDDDSLARLQRPDHVPVAALQTDEERVPVVEPDVKPPDEQSALQRVTGLVVDEAGRPVAGAELCAGPDAARVVPVARADDAGRFELAIDVDLAVACARAAGWAPSPAVRLTDAQRAGAAPLVLRLSTRGAELEVLVRDELGAPVAGASVTAGREREMEYRLADGTTGRTVPGFTLATDAAGVARFASLAPGWLRVRVEHPDFAPVTSFATLELFEPQRVDVTLEAGIHVEGRVHDESGAPVAGAEVRRGSTRLFTLTDARGDFRIGPMEPGKLVVTGPHGRSAVRRVPGSPGETVRWDPVLLSEPALRGRVSRPDGSAAAGVLVRACNDTWPGWQRETRAEPDGSFAVFGCPAKAALRVEVRRLESDAFPALVHEGARAGGSELALTLPRAEPATLRGVLQRDGDEPSAQHVELRHVTTPGRQRLTAEPGVRLDCDETGGFLLQGLPAGQYELVALGPPLAWARLASVALEPGAEHDLGTIALPRPGLLRTSLARAPGPATAEATFLLERRADLATVFHVAGEMPEQLSLAPGTYTLQLEVTPGPQREYSFEIVSGRTHELAIELSPTSRHRIIVRYASGRAPTSVVEVEVERLDRAELAASGRASRGEGADVFLDVDLVPGRYAVRASDERGLETEVVHDLFTSRPGREVVVVLDDE